MLDLDNYRWSELRHAYGDASDIPPLLRKLESLPKCDFDEEPWSSLWSSLAHQGDVYSASFAAVPYVIQALASSPVSVDLAYFQFPAWVEICRSKKDVAVPEDLEPAYFDALSQLPSLVAAAASRPWDADFLRCALSAIAVAKNQPEIAEAVLELSPEVAKEFMEWFFSR